MGPVAGPLIVSGRRGLTCRYPVGWPSGKVFGCPGLLPGVVLANVFKPATSRAGRHGVKRKRRTVWLDRPGWRLSLGLTSTLVMRVRPVGSPE